MPRRSPVRRLRIGSARGRRRLPGAGMEDKDMEASVREVTGLGGLARCVTPATTVRVRPEPAAANDDRLGLSRPTFDPGVVALIHRPARPPMTAGRATSRYWTLRFEP